MSQADAIYITLAVVLAAFFLFTAILRQRYPGQPYLFWMMTAIATMGVSFVIETVLSDPGVKALAIVVLYTASAALASQTVLVLSGLRQRFPATLPVAIVLSATTIVADMQGIPFVYNTIPFHIGVGLMLIEAGWRIRSRAEAKTTDRAIAGCLFSMALIFSLRGAGFQLAFVPLTPFSDIVVSDYSMLTIIAMALPSITLALLLIFRLADAAASHYLEVSKTDSLTGLLNRNAFADIASGRGPGSFMILCDIDGFKRVNDSWGHAAGDTALCVLAGLFNQLGLVAGRMGGEEFAILLQRATSEQARLIAEGLRTAYSLQSVDGIPNNERLTASFGVAEYDENESFDSIFCRADKALYEAKNTGRNRVVVARGSSRKFQPLKPEERVAELRARMRR